MRKISKFLRVVCPRCRKHKMIFGKATLKVKCNACNYLLIKTKGGKAKVRAPVKEVLLG
ncbi:MAG: 30S ribosomal protein S27e [Candidatus Pacearchaeota archaeon]